MLTSRDTKYKAFISYAHADKAWANWLHKSLENYRPPKPLTNDQTLRPIFRDQDDLASATTLSDSLVAALANSAALIVICSPAAAASKWVNSEIEVFQQNHPERSILCLIAEGNPPDCFPKALRSNEPLAADARKIGDGRKDALLKIAAALLGVDLDELKQRELRRRNQRLLAFSSATFLGLIAASALAIYAFMARNEAIRQAQIASATTDFVIEVFEVADPSEARGQAVTAKEILDRGVDRVNSRMGPAVQSRLLQTLGRVYNGLGLYNTAKTLLSQSDEIRHSWETKIALADTHFMLGNYPTAIASFRQLIAEYDADWDTALARMHNGLGDALNYSGKPELAIAELTPSLEANLKVFGDAHEITAHTLSSLGSAYYFAEQADQARDLYAQAYEAAVASVGEFHPTTVTLLNDLANINYITNRIPLALQGYRQALPYYEKVFGANHPEVATIRNNIGRILFETNRSEEAVEWLERAVDTFDALALESHPTTVHLHNTLGLSLKTQGDSASAIEALTRAVTAAKQTEHPLLGPILVELADLHCRLGEKLEGKKLLDRAKAKLQRFAEQPWRLAIAKSVELGCQGQPSTKLAMTNAYIEIKEHYGAEHPFTQDAQQRLNNL